MHHNKEGGKNDFSSINDLYMSHTHENSKTTKTEIRASQQ